MEIKNIKVCKSFKNRFLGMMFQKKKTEYGYLFKKCHSIHTFFCFFNLDVILLDKNMKIIDIKRNLKPWRIYFFQCDSILEYASGFVPDNLKKNIEIKPL